MYRTHITQGFFHKEGGGDKRTILNIEDYRRPIKGGGKCSS